MKRLAVLGAAAVLSTVTAATPATSQNVYPKPSSVQVVTHPQCTATDFRAQARESFHPWYRKATDRYKLRRLLGCAQNQKTFRAMKRIRERQEAGKKQAVDRYHALTPYPGCGELDRNPIPPSITARESGCQWDIWNTSGSSACGPFQLLGHGQPCHPYPDVVRGMKEKMAHYRIAHELWLICGETSCGWGASA